MKSLLLPAAALLALLLGACSDIFPGNGEPDEPPPAANRMSLTVTPNPAVAGDSLVFQVRHDNEREKKLEYSWKLSGRANSYFESWTTKQQQLRVVAPQEPGRYEITLKIRGTGYTQVQTWEDFNIVAKSVPPP